MPGWDWAFWTTGGLTALAGLSLCAWALLHDRPRARRRCPRCWYDMSAVRGMTCPECGRTTRKERRFFRTRRRWRWAFLGGAMLIIGAAGVCVPLVASGDWVLWVPARALSAGMSLFDRRAEAEHAKWFVPTPTVGGQASRLNVAGATSWERLLLARRSAAAIDDGLSVYAAVSDLVSLGVQARVAEPAILRRLASTNDTRQLRAVELLDRRVSTPILRHVARRHTFAAMRRRALLLLPVSDQTLGDFAAALRDPDESVRLSALGSLILAASPPGTPPPKTAPPPKTPGAPPGSPPVPDAVRRRVLTMLLDASSDHSPEVRAKAVRGALLVSAGTRPRPDALAKMWDREPSGTVRAVIAEAAARVARPDQALPYLEAVLADPDEAARLEVLGVIRRLGTRAAACTTPVAAAAWRGPMRTTGEAVVTLGSLGPAAAPELGALLQHPDAKIRALAARSVGALGQDGCAARAPVIRALDDPEADVRRQAARALRQCPDSGLAARAKLAEMTRADDDQTAATEAQRTLDALDALARRRAARP